MIPLSLSVKRSAWRQQDQHALHADQAFQAVRRDILERDSYTCQAIDCHFSVHPKSNQKNHPVSFLEVHHLDGDHHNQNEDNLITLCPLCHSCFHLGHLLTDNSGNKVSRGTLIYLPEAPQGQLNQLVRTLFIGMELCQANDLPIRRKIEAAFKQLRSRNQHVQKLLLPFPTDHYLQDFGNMLLSLGKNDFQIVAQAVSLDNGFRFLPYPDGFHKAIRFWAHHQFNAFPIASWTQVLEQARHWLEAG